MLLKQIFKISTSTNPLGTLITIFRETSDFMPLDFNNVEIISPTYGTTNMSFASATESVFDEAGIRFVSYEFPDNDTFANEETITINVT